MKRISRKSFALPVRPSGLSNDDLLQSCRRTHKFWVDARPFFVELFKRIEKDQIPHVHTKTEACRLIGCSLRWAEKIVADTAKHSTKTVANQPSEGRSKDLEMLTEKEYLNDITSYAFRKLQPLLERGEWDRYQRICRLLAKHFAHVRRIRAESNESESALRGEEDAR